MTDAGSELARAALVATLAPVLGNGSAGRCSELLLTHGVSTVPDDWKLLERADRGLAWCVLQELKEQVGLTTMQLARVPKHVFLRWPAWL
jgi:cytosine/adenosine deaminase-related metal-dependent hydrolase